MKNKYPSVILELHEKFKSNEFLNNYYGVIKNLQLDAKNKYNSIITSLPIELNSNYDSDDLLWNVPYSLKDNFSTKDIKTTGGSLLLQDYVPVFNSTVYENLLSNSHSILISKDSLDEFGLGGSGTWSAFGRVKNPYNEEYITAGSSSGSAVNVSIGLSTFAIGTDTGGSVRHPASFLSITGFKPSYGLISRYGVFPFSPSLDTVGILAKYVTDIAIVLERIASVDKKDFTNIRYNDGEYNFYENLSEIDLKNIRFAYLKNVLNLMDEDLKKDWIKYLNYLKKYITVEEIEWDEKFIDILLPVYKTIAYAESTTSLANLTGMTFGKQIVGKNFRDSCVLTRTNYLGEEVRNRFLVGNFVLSKDNYENTFIKAKKVRRILKQKMQEIFKKFDCLILPGAGNYTLSLSDSLSKGDSKCNDLLLLSNFAGTPSLTIPALDKKPQFCGINLNCDWLQDQKLLNIGLTLEKINKEYLKSNN